MAEFLSDIEIAQQAKTQIINSIADKAGIPDQHLQKCRHCSVCL